MTFTPAQLNRRAELYHQLGAMITAGVPLIQALQMAANNSALRASGQTISTLVDHLKNGLTFHESMVRAHGWMPEFDVALLSAGEQSGRLDASFKFLGEYYSARAVLIRDTISSLILPTVNLHVFLLIFSPFLLFSKNPLAFFIGFVLGIVNGDYKLCLPFIFEKMIVFGALWGIILFLIFACQARRGERWRSFLESLTKIVSPLYTALQYLALTRLSAALDALVESGVSIIKAWPLAAAAGGSPHLKREVATWEPELEGGTTPAELVSRTWYFPEMFKNLYYTGEVSGKLDDSLKRLHVYYREEGMRKLRMCARIFSGTIYGLVAALIAYNVIKFWMNYYGGLMNGV